MSKPVRIQRKRVKGWRMPENTVYVGRPTIWGNPFFHAQRYAGLDVCLRVYENAVHGVWNPDELKALGDGPFRVAYQDWNAWRFKFCEHPAEAVRRELRGKNLACWCALDKPCHADVLLEVANEGQEIQQDLGRTEGECD